MVGGYELNSNSTWLGSGSIQHSKIVEALENQNVYQNPSKQLRYANATVFSMWWAKKSVDVFFSGITAGSTCDPSSVPVTSHRQSLIYPVDSSSQRSALCISPPDLWVTQLHVITPRVMTRKKKASFLKLKDKRGWVFSFKGKPSGFFWEPWGKFWGFFRELFGEASGKMWDFFLWKTHLHQKESPPIPPPERRKWLMQTYGCLLLYRLKKNWDSTSYPHFQKYSWMAYRSHDFLKEI